MLTAQNVNAFPVVISYTPTGTIAVGEPVGYDGAIAAADEAGILGVAMEPVTVADKVSSVLVYGTMKVTGGGVIAAGTRLKVGATGKFVAIAGTDLADGKCVATAITDCAADDAEFVIFVGKF